MKIKIKLKKKMIELEKKRALELHGELERARNESQILLEKQQQQEKKMQELKRAKEELEESKLCTFCLERSVAIILLPCGHACLCKECAKLLGTKTLVNCPICRVPITHYHDVYV